MNNITVLIIMIIITMIIIIIIIVDVNATCWTGADRSACPRRGSAPARRLLHVCVYVYIYIYI